jgi:hypothetical protein
VLYDEKKVKLAMGHAMTICASVFLIVGSLLIIFSDSMGAPKSLPPDFPDALRVSSGDQTFHRLKPFHGNLGMSNLLRDHKNPFAPYRFQPESSLKTQRDPSTVRRYIAPAGLTIKWVDVDELSADIHKKAPKTRPATLPQAFTIQLGDHQFMAEAPKKGRLRGSGSVSRSGNRTVITYTVDKNAPETYLFKYQAKAVTVPEDAVGKEIPFSVYDPAKGAPEVPDTVFVVSRQHYDLWNRLQQGGNSDATWAFGLAMATVGLICGALAVMSYRSVLPVVRSNSAKFSTSTETVPPPSAVPNPPAPQVVVIVAGSGFQPSPVDVEMLKGRGEFPADARIVALPGQPWKKVDEAVRQGRTMAMMTGVRIDEDFDDQVRVLPFGDDKKFLLVTISS